MTNENPDIDLCDLRKRIGQDHREPPTQFNLLGIREEVALGVVDGLTAILDDDKFVDRYWERGWDRIAKHMTTSSQQWFGKRALTAAVLVIVAWGVGWLIRNGAIK